MSEQEQVAEQGRTDIQTVTGETLDAYNAEKMGWKPDEPVIEGELVEAEGEEVPPEKETDNELEAEPEPEPEKPAKKKNGVQERISEVIAERNAERERARQLEAELAEARKGKAPEPQPEQQALTKPKVDDYSDVTLYEKDLMDYTREMIRAESRAEETVRAQQRVEQSWKAKIDAAKESLPDYDEVISSTTAEVHAAVREAIFESDIGPQLAYHLAANPDIAESLKAMSIASQVREIGKLEAKLSGESTPAAKPAVQTSKAPAPITPIKAATSMIDNKIDANGEFHGTPEEYKALRRAGKIK